jgi:two-component system chemotaxis sensor kinase CheA
MNPLLEQFLLESRDALEEIGNLLLELERDSQDGSALRELFRLVHTLKGNSGLFEFPLLTRVTHAAEDLLDQLREGNLEIDGELTDDLFAAMDFISRLLTEIEQTGAIPEDWQEEAEQLINRLRLRLSRIEAAGEDDSQEADDVGLTPPDWHWCDRLSETDRQRVLAASPQELWGLRYVPEPECFFKGEDPLYTVRQVPGLAGLVITPREPWPDPSQTDIYRANLIFDLLAAASRRDLEDHFRYVPEQVAIYPVNLETPQGKEEPTARGEYAALWQEVYNNQRYILLLPVSASQWQGRLTSVAATLTALYQAREDERSLARLDQTLNEATKTRSFAPLLAFLDDPLNGGQPLDELGLISGPDRKAAGPRPEEAAHEERAGRILKVPKERVDRLMKLIGEMVVAKNALPYTAARAEDVFGSRELAREIKSQWAVINRISEEMQDAIMQVRMLPVGTVFQRFPRMVRDLAKKLEKDVHFLMEGEEAEADKDVIEALADPLIHLLRNSLDHGIEPPVERAATNKPRQGKLLLSAHHEGDRLIIQVEDDGRGIDPLAIKLKAFEKGLIDEAKLDALSDAEAKELIFAPGFSTSKEVSDLSGRGVGMDVVRTSIARLGGDVRLGGNKGEGSRTTLSLPLSMMVTNIMLVKLGNRAFGVPLEHIVETVRVPEPEIHQFKDRQVALLRGRLVPLHGLDQLLGLDTAPRPNEEGEFAVLVARMGGEHLGLVVDGFSQTIDIILKPLEGPLADLAGFAGTALMGDGSVLLVLNLKELC